MDKSRWMKSGSKAVAEEQARQERLRQQKFARKWFWVGVSEKDPITGKFIDNSKTIIFLDNFEWKNQDGNDVVPKVINFHSLVPHGDWKETIHAPCVSADRPCLLCRAGFTTRMSIMLSILDITPFYSKKDHKIVTRPRPGILPCTQETWKCVENRLERLGNLRGWRFNVARTDKKSSRTGTDFVHEEKIDDLPKWLADKGLMPPPDAKYKLDLNPWGLDADAADAWYHKTFAAMTDEEMQNVLNQFQGSLDDGWEYKGDSKEDSSQQEEVASDVVNFQ